MKQYFIYIFSRLVLNIPAFFKFLDSSHQQGLRIIYYHMVSEKKHNYYFKDLTLQRYLTLFEKFSYASSSM